MIECCMNCKNRYSLIQYDYSKGGCTHTKMNGFACFLPSIEKEVIWMIGNREDIDKCECFIPKNN